MRRPTRSRTSAASLGPAALPETDFTARVDPPACRPGSGIFYRVVFQDLADPKVAERSGRRALPHAAGGSPDDHRSPGPATRPARAGASTRAWGGMRLYEAMRRASPDFFIHCGDQIYADGPILAEVTLDDGTVWKNIVTPEKSKVAETLAEFRGNFAYNLLDEHMRRFNAEVPLLAQWDDHEMRNNWYPGQILARRALHGSAARRCWPRARGRRSSSTTPMRIDPADPERIYRSLRVRPLARGLRARRAELPRAELAEPAGRARRRDRIPGHRAARVAEARARWPRARPGR